MSEQKTEIKWLAPSGNKVGGSAQGHEVLVSFCKNAKNTQIPFRTVITLYPSFMKKNRLIAGDRMAVAVHDGYLLLKRVSESGFKLTVASKNIKSTEKYVTSNFSFATNAMKLKRFYSDSDIIVDNDGVIHLPIDGKI